MYTLNRIYLAYLLLLIQMACLPTPAWSDCGSISAAGSNCNTCSPCATTSEKLCPPCTCCDLTNCDNDIYGKTHFTGRSQSRATYRWLVGTHDQLYRYDTDNLYGTFSIITEYNQTFRDDRIATFVLPTGNNCFRFGPDTTVIDDQTNMTVGMLTNVRSQDFGLSSSYQACVCVEPRYKNFIADLHLDIALDEWFCGMFGYIDVPVVHVSVDPRCCVTEIVPGEPFFPGCLMSNADSDDQLLDVPVGAMSAMEALQGNFVWGQVNAPLAKGILCGCGKQTKTGVAEIRAGLGYNFLLTECASLGIKVVAAAPTGNRPCGRFVFEPIIGNQGHWELGGGIVGHALLWERDDNRSLSAHVDSEFTYMFASRRQTRLFDLAGNGPWSRYLLLKQFATNAAGASVYDALARGPNIFAQELNVKIDIQADVTALISYTHCGFIADIGYNFWGRSREKATQVCCCIPKNTFGIKGDLPVCDPSDPLASVISTASLSTISTTHGIQEFDDGACSPVYVTCADLDICSALNPSAWSNSILANVGYRWDDCDYTPFFGVGARVELSGQRNRAFNLWGVWAKGAISF